MWVKIKTSIVGLFEGKQYSYSAGQIVNLPEKLFVEFEKKGIAVVEPNRPLAERLKHEHVANYFNPKTYQRKRK